jgi:hypothetical protein
MTLREALRLALDDIYWMSAASDFGPDGIAQKGWFQVRDRCYATEVFLKEVEDDTEEVKKHDSF